VRFWQTGIVWWIVSVMGDYIWRYETANTYSRVIYSSSLLVSTSIQPMVSISFC